MATIDLNNPNELFNEHFVTIGEKLSEQTVEQKRKLRRKIGNQRKTKVEGNWATLGWKRNGKKFRPKGKIHASTKGNDHSTGVTLEMIQMLRESNPLAETDKFVLERYIDLSEVDFGVSTVAGHTLDDLPELRLTIFVNKDEGALVYFDYGSEKNRPIDLGVDFLLPNRTDKLFSFNRDRLTYHIPLLAKEDLAKMAEGESGSGEGEVLAERARLVIKVLTFKRRVAPPKEILLENIWLQNDKLIKDGQADKVSEKNVLWRFNEQINDFEEVGVRINIDTKAKTLLLIHGTFASTAQSYGGFYKNEGNFLQNLINTGKYGQVLAFDHRTVFDDATANINALKYLLGNIQFEQSVSLMGTSRGGVLCYAIAGTKIPHFEVDKVLTVSAGFGVAYLSKARHAFKILKILKVLLGWNIPLVLQLAQYSGEWILKQPGLEQITPKHDRLNKVMQMKPVSSSTKYQNIRTDWNKSVPSGKLLLGPLALVDLMIKPVLGKKHDWVVGYNNQSHRIDGSSLNDLDIVSVHTKVLKPGTSNPDSHALCNNFL